MLTQSRAMQLRRPGLYFQEKNLPVRFDLPALDVAAFVGFAERGPLDTPVAVENVDTFRAIFGADLAIARKPNGDIRYAGLASAVSDFFANRGRRCYVVRVAGDAAAAGQFCLPGLLRFDTQPGDTATDVVPNSVPSQAPNRVAVDAASPGTWSNALRLATQLRVTSLAASGFELEIQANSTPLLWQTARSSPALEAGELLRLTLGDAQTRLLVAVEAAIPGAATAANRPSDVTALALNRSHIWRQLNSAQELMLELGIASPLELPTDEPVANVAHVRLLTCRGSRSLPATGTLGPNQAVAGTTELGFQLTLTPTVENDPVTNPAAGDLLQLTISRDGSVNGELTVLASVESIEPHIAHASTVAVDDAADIVADDTENRLHVQTGALLMPLPHPNELLDLPVTVLTQVERLRFDLLVQDGEQQRTILGDLGFNPAHPRFWGDLLLLESSPLLRSPSAVEQTYINQAEVARAKRAAERFRAMQSPIRNPQIEDAEPGTVEDRAVALAGRLAPLAKAEHTFLPLGMRYFFDVENLAEPLSDHLGHDGLTSYSASLFLDEQLVPNPAVQSRTGTTLNQQATDLYSIQQQRLRGIHSLYPIDEVALISVPDAIHVGWKAADVLAPPPEPEPEVCPEPDLSRFQRCDVEECEPEDSGETPVTQGQDNSSAELSLPELIIPEDVAQLDGFATTYRTLLELHHALINIAQARRDWVTILTLPELFEARHCTEWAGALRQRLGLPPRDGVYSGHSDLADLSYAAVYHPWLITTNAKNQVRTGSPDGAVCGVIAARALERGAWIAPANVPLQNVLGLYPQLSEAAWGDLFSLGFNLIRAEPLDFRMMSAHTLSDEREWLQLSIRRLLILLRKVALERGGDYVFENNGEQFRNAIELFFGRILQMLFERGALRGATPQQAYRLITDERVNTANDRDNGRFFTEIQVAPSHPMEFITVRLLRTIDGQTQVTEIRTENNR